MPEISNCTARTDRIDDLLMAASLRWDRRLLLYPYANKGGSLLFHWRADRSRILKNFGGVVSEPRALAALQRNVPAVRPPFEAIDHVSKARAALGEVGRIDLRDVAEYHHFRTRSRARDQGFHLLGRKILRFIDNQILVDEGAAAHEVQRLDLDA